MPITLTLHVHVEKSPENDKKRQELARNGQNRAKSEKSIKRGDDWPK